MHRGGNGGPVMSRRAWSILSTHVQHHRTTYNISIFSKMIQEDHDLVEK